MTRFYFETFSIDTEYDPRISQKPQYPKVLWSPSFCLQILLLKINFLQFE